MLRLPYKKLQIWQKAMDVSEGLYHLTKQFPKEELYGMTSQIRRSSASVSANIAEGSQRKTNGEFSQFIGIAQGSLAELETHLILSQRVQLIDKEKLENCLSTISELGKMLHAFQSRLTTSH